MTTKIFQQKKFLDLRYKAVFQTCARSVRTLKLQITVTLLFYLHSQGSPILWLVLRSIHLHGYSMQLCAHVGHQLDRGQSLGGMNDVGIFGEW